MAKKHSSLGFWTLTSLVIGNMVGSGIFLLPSSLAQLGTVSLFSWVITALGSLCIALVFARLSILFPKTGGPYIYCKEGFGDFVGFQVAYNYWIYMWTGNAAIALALTGYLAAFFPELSSNNLYGFLVTAGAVWFFTLINIIGLRFAALIQLTLTILKFFPLLFLSLVGLFFIKGGNFSKELFNISGTSTLSALSSGAFLTLWAFLGMESASIPADEVMDPKKNIPRATLAGTLASAAIYIVSTLAIMGTISVTALKGSTAPFADFAAILFGPIGKDIFALVAILACAGTLHGWILLQGQIPLAAAKDGLFPQGFAKLSTRRTPVFGIVLSSTLVTSLLYLNFDKSLVDKFTFVISLAILAALIPYLFTTIAAFLVTDGNKRLGKRFLCLAAIAFAYCFWAVINSGTETVFYGTLLLFSSIPVYAYLVWQRGSSKRAL